ncbi:MAG: PhzF family phenazine biosynthesis protein [Gammaproteobacteria bacterium]|nr:PhzF family phenazine biosynthesis protein [Gammaproteobacteria bacterium]
MELTLYQIDAFASKAFEGNPAAVCPLEQWLPDDLMQRIAMENNLSETAFFVRTGEGYHIRWFTPTREVDLCGHATLASAYVIFKLLDYAGQTLVFQSKSGVLTVQKKNDWLEMDFPSQPPEECVIPPQIIEAFDVRPVRCLKREDYIVVLQNEKDVLSANPDFTTLSKLDRRGVAITATSTQYDFVVRFFAPKFGINEDPITGSAFTQLIPYWAKVLGKTELKAKQVSKRGGEVWCGLAGSRVKIRGKAVTYLSGAIELEP